MGRNLSGDAHGSSAGRSSDHDDVFVPHYERYAQSLATTGANTPVVMPRLNPKLAPRLKAVEKSGRVRLLARLSSSSPATIEPAAASHGVKSQPQPWQTSTNDGFSSTTRSLDNVQQSWVGVHHRLSEFQVALQASERAREDGERETKALRLYVANVETAAAGLLTRIQDLEGLLSLSLSQEQDVDHLRGKVATETLKELQKQVAAAAQAIATAREATMTLDKVKRESHALIKAQEAEIGRLSRESAECRMLYEARGKHIQELTDQIVRLNVQLGDSQRTSQLQLMSYQKRFEAAKFVAIEKADQCDELMRALELSTAVGKAAEQKLEELLHEKKDVLLKNELLEQQVKELQIRVLGGRIADYEHELCQVRAALGGEKAHLLDDLAHLRRSHQSSTQQRETLNSWHETKSMTPTPPQWSSDQHSAISQQSTNAQLVTKQTRTTKFSRGARCDESPPSVETRGAQGLVASKSAGGCNFPQEEVDQDGRLSVSASVSASGSWDTNASSCSNQASRVKEFEQSVCRISALYRNRGGDMRSAQFASSQHLDANEEDLEGSEAKSTEAIMSSGLKDFSLLAAAQREISKMKEVCAF